MPSLLMPSGTRRPHRPDHHEWWRGWAAAAIVLAVLSFTGWVVYTHLIAPPIPIERRRLEVSALPQALRDTTADAPVPPQRIAAIRRLATCRRNDVDTRVRALTDSYPRWPDPVLAGAACHEIRPGMSREQLRVALGDPTRIVPTTTPWRPIETWYYGKKLSVILWDGLVKSWQ
jgi:hypothetical protein